MWWTSIHINSLKIGINANFLQSIMDSTTSKMVDTLKLVLYTLIKLQGLVLSNTSFLLQCRSLLAKWSPKFWPRSPDALCYEKSCQCHHTKIKEINWQIDYPYKKSITNSKETLKVTPSCPLHGKMAYKVKGFWEMM